MDRFRTDPRWCRSSVAPWVLAWGLGILTVAAPLEAMGEPVSLTTPGAADQTPAVDLEVIGTSLTTGEGGGQTRLIYSLVIGDPRRAEERAYAFSHRFGMYALDANLWTRVRPEDSEQWRQTTLRRPVTLAEIETFATTPDAFKVEVLGGVVLLPRPFRDLDEPELASIDYIVGYMLGGTRAELRIGVTRDDAHVLLRRLRGLLEPPQ